MIIHQAIKYLYRNYGYGILLEKRLFNLMKDFHFFDYEESTLQATFDIVIKQYGEHLYNGIISRNWASTYNRIIMDCKNKFGFKDELVTYIFESIAYGFDMLEKISKNYIYPLTDRKSRWESYMIFYQLCGFHLLPIKGDVDNWRSNEKSFKNPAYGSWRDFKDIDLNTGLIKDIVSNKDYTGFGGLLGINNIRVLDFDDIGLFAKVVNGPWDDNNPKFDEFVKYCLTLLELPKDYQWVIRSGGGCGFHIIFKTEEVPNFNPEIISFQSRKSLTKDKLDVKALDLLWNGYVALPPTAAAGAFNHDLYETYPFIYRFKNRNIFPDYEPLFVSIGNLNNFLNQYCSEDNFYGGWLESTVLYGNSKISSEYGSYTNDYLSYNDAIEWLELCDTVEGQNMAAIKYIENKQFDKAAETLSKISTFSFAAYNYAVLMSYKYVPYSSILFTNLRQVFEQDTRISKYHVERLYERIESIISN